MTLLHKILAWLAAPGHGAQRDAATAPDSAHETPGARGLAEIERVVDLHLAELLGFTHGVAVTAMARLNSGIDADALEQAAQSLDALEQAAGRLTENAGAVGVRAVALLRATAEYRQIVQRAAKMAAKGAA